MLKKIKQSLVISTVCIIMSSTAMASSSVKDAITSAEMANAKAAHVGYEWRDTGKLIKKAKTLAKKGKAKKAMALALKAKDQAELAVAQYKSESARYAENH